MRAPLRLPPAARPRGPVAIDSDDPDLKIQAIHRDSCRKNTADVPTMVRYLNDDDPAIRFYAIQALRNMTHEDFDYRFYEDDDQRKPAIARWQAWLKTQR